MFEFIRVAAVNPGVSVGDTAQNRLAVIQAAKDAAAQGAELAVFPELCITGYICADLFFQKPLLDTAARAVSEIACALTDTPIVIVVGLPVDIDGRLVNAAAVIYKGKLWGIVPKTYIPNYNEFYEDRWFTPAYDVPEASVSSESFGFGAVYDVPVGTDLVFDAFGCRFGVELCEDLWAPVPPSSRLALAGCEVILNLSASNETIGKREYRRSLIGKQSAACLCGYVYASAGRLESTTDLVFSGYNAVFENGVCLAEEPALLSAAGAIAADIDLGRLRADRRKLKTFSDCGRVSGMPTRRIVIDRQESAADGSLHPVEKLPFVPSAREDRRKRCLDIFEMQCMGLDKRARVVGYHPVIGVSGGLDSTLALLVSAGMMKKAGRPMSDVVGITLPCFGTTARTHNNSVKLMEAIGITALEIDIKAAASLHCRDIGHPEDQFDVTYENIQARERTQVLMDYACKIGGFVVGTGDLSELALGWCTYNADHMSMYGVNASIPKTLIRWMIESIMEYKIFPEAAQVLADILDTPISPELLPPDAQGNIAQQTEEIIGPYALHDFFLYYMLRFGFAPDKIYYLAKRAFAKDFDAQTILKWERVFYKRFFSQQFKRSCLPDGVKVGSVCLSPRGDWRMPSDASAHIWLNMLDRMETI
ncbi:MAG: NAD(+) synthase [Clostridia bacterium]|nr:NAD(+) synthase [Clostridia bacterium]